MGSPAGKRARSPSFSWRGASRVSRSPGRSNRCGTRRLGSSPTFASRRHRRWRCSTPPSTSPAWWTIPIHGSWFHPASRVCGSSAALTDPYGSVEIRRRGGDGDELIVDIAVTAPDGTTCVDVRSLRYTDVESRQAQTPSRGADPRELAHRSSGGRGAKARIGCRRRVDRAHSPCSLARRCPRRSPKSARRCGLHTGRCGRGAVRALCRRARAGGRRHRLRRADVDGSR